MDKCMTMPGGGFFHLAPGQITDDSELAMCQMHALIEQGEDFAQGNFDANKIALWYKKWVESEPFDIGASTINALSPLKKDPRWSAAVEAAKAKNADS